MVCCLTPLTPVMCSVTFGIMTKEDIARALEVDPQTPTSRTKLAVPFIGKGA